ncbi:MAG: hypothetical protein KC492_26885, partial [Myxococcales bacterium]|nr:hypothetical protein [Myxococcales bacterium]
QTQDGAAQPSAAPSAVSSAPSASASASAEPAPLPPGCYDEIQDETGKAALSKLETACATGMDALLPQVLEVELEPGGRREIPVTVIDTGKCLRAAAAAEGDAELRLELKSRDDSSVAQAKLGRGYVVLNGDGPICVASPGQYRVIIHMDKGKTKVYAQVWQGK